MTEQLLNQMRLHAKNALSNTASTRMGIVSAFDPEIYSVKVIIQPEDADNVSATLTGWLPIFSPWVGNGWGMFAPPAVGSMCAVHFSEANFDGAFVTLCGFNQQFAPLSVPTGEFWLVHDSGSFIKLTNNGDIEISGNVNVNLGKLSAGSLKKLLTETAADVYNSHTHPSNGSPPDQTMQATDMTLYTEAN